MSFFFFVKHRLLWQRIFYPSPLLTAGGIALGINIPIFRLAGRCSATNIATLPPAIFPFVNVLSATWHSNLPFFLTVFVTAINKMPWYPFF